MRTCINCKYADWYLTSSGRKHPNGQGNCTYVVIFPTLPASMNWLHIPIVVGGHINRNNRVINDCPTFESIKVGGLK